jgi:opacity protein-like surface antigen
MQKKVRVIVPIALAVLMVAPAAAAEPGWTVRLSGAWVRPSVDLPAVDSAVPVDASSNDALGAGVGVEYRLHPWVGLGVDAFYARPDMVLEADFPGGRRRVTDGLGFMPFSLGPVFHLTPGKTVDLTFSAVVGLIDYGDLRFAVDTAELRLKGGRDVGWGLGAAVDIHPSGSNWALHAGVRRYESDPEFTNLDNGAKARATFNPVVVTLGIGYRF